MSELPLIISILTENWTRIFLRHKVENNATDSGRDFPKLDWNHVDIMY